MTQPTIPSTLPIPQPSPTITLTPPQTINFEHGLTLILNTWPALSLAVENEFGGPDSADKRDWMCGAVAELFESTPDTTTDDLEIFLSALLLDEFSTSLEDDSSYHTAQKIILLRTQCSQSNFSALPVLQDVWEKVTGAGKKRVQVVQTEILDDDGEDDGSDDEDEDDEDEDDEMDIDGDDDTSKESKREGEIPQLVPVRERVEKVLDGDGFELVQSRRSKRK